MLLDLDILEMLILINILLRQQMAPIPLYFFLSSVCSQACHKPSNLYNYAFCWCMYKLLDFFLELFTKFYQDMLHGIIYIPLNMLYDSTILWYVPIQNENFNACSFKKIIFQGNKYVGFVDDFWCHCGFLYCDYCSLNCLVLAEQMVPLFIAIFINCSETIKHYYNTGMCT